MKYLLLLIIKTLYSQIIDKPKTIHVDLKSKMFKDHNGRDMFFRGVNVVYKVFPYYPELETFNVVTSFVDKDMEDLKKYGFNLIRLGVEWAGYEPSPGKFNQTYIEILKGIVQRAKKYGIYTLLDFHEDSLARKLCGEGIPNWAVHATSWSFEFPFPIKFKPFTKDPNPYSKECNSNPWFNYELSMVSSSAYQSLYDNAEKVRDSFGEFWKNVAKEFKDEEYVIGYELMNEPFAGNIYKDILLLYPGVADYFNLQNLYDHLQKKIREVDDNHIIYFQSVTWNGLLPNGFTHVPGGYDYLNRSSISYHYSSLLNPDRHMFMAERVLDKDRLRCGTLLTEWGYGNDKEYVDDFFNLFEIYKESVIGWGYKSFAGITGDTGVFYNSNGTVNHDVVYNNARTLPKKVAGNTRKIHFNPDTNYFELVYEICASCGDTEIYLNYDFRYPNGYDITLSQNNVNYTSPEPNLILIHHSHETEGLDLTVTITPK